MYLIVQEWKDFYVPQVTVSTVNMLTTVLNDSPIFPENEEEQADLSAPLLMDSPQVRVSPHFVSQHVLPCSAVWYKKGKNLLYRGSRHCNVRHWLAKE